MLIVKYITCMRWGGMNLVQRVHLFSTRKVASILSTVLPRKRGESCMNIKNTIFCFEMVTVHIFSHILLIQKIGHPFQFVCTDDVVHKH